MNISEANAVNDVLRLLLDHPRPGAERITSAEAYEAAELLAQKAYKALSAGLRELDVSHLWPQALHRRIEAALKLVDGYEIAKTVGPLTVAELRRVLTGEAGDG